MKKLFTAARALVVMAEAPLCAEGKAPRYRNILIIYADDLGYGDVQCYNRQRGKVPTPHIGRLAAHRIKHTTNATF